LHPELESLLFTEIGQRKLNKSDFEVLTRKYPSAIISKKSGKSTLLILEENIDYLILGGGNLKNEKFENNNFDNVKPSYENLNFIKGEIFQKISIDSLCQIMIKYNQPLHISEIFDIYYNEELWQWRLNRNLLWNIAIDIIEEKIISELNLGIGSKIYVVDADFLCHKSYCHE